MKLSLTWFQVAAHNGIEKPKGENTAREMEI